MKVDLIWERLLKEDSGIIILPDGTRYEGDMVQGNKEAIKFKILIFLQFQMWIKIR